MIDEGDSWGGKLTDTDVVRFLCGASNTTRCLLSCVGSQDRSARVPPFTHRTAVAEPGRCWTPGGRWRSRSVQQGGRGGLSRENSRGVRGLCPGTCVLCARFSNAVVYHGSATGSGRPACRGCRGMDGMLVLCLSTTAP